VLDVRKFISSPLALRILDHAAIITVMLILFSFVRWAAG